MNEYTIEKHNWWKQNKMDVWATSYLFNVGLGRHMYDTEKINVAYKAQKNVTVSSVVHYLWYQKYKITHTLCVISRIQK